MSARRASPGAAALALAALAGCVAPPFPERAPYAYGWAPKIAEARAAAEAAGDLDRLEALDHVDASVCPSWDDVRMDHPLDAAFGNPAPADGRALGCHTARALDAMVARREDLAPRPRAESPAPAAALARSVTRHRETGPAPLAQRAATVEGL